MNNIEINIAKQKLLNECRNFSSSISSIGTTKEVKIDGEYSAIICVGPTLFNVASLGIIKNSNSGQHFVKLEKMTGDNAKKISSELIDKVFSELETGRL